MRGALMSVSTFFRRHTAAWLGSPAGRYTAGEVRRLLDPKAEGADQERRRAVLATASLPGAWTERLDPREAWSLGRLAGRLPTVVGFYASGLSLDEIRERIGTW